MHPIMISAEVLTRSYAMCVFPPSQERDTVPALTREKKSSAPLTMLGERARTSTPIDGADAGLDSSPGYNESAIAWPGQMAAMGEMDFHTQGDRDDVFTTDADEVRVCVFAVCDFVSHVVVNAPTHPATLSSLNDEQPAGQHNVE